MLSDFVGALERMSYFLKEFDAAWRSERMKSLFPVNARDVLEDVEATVGKLTKKPDIVETFASWRSIGVWNASDLITFLLTSRFTMFLADAIEKDDRDAVKNAIDYYLHFVNYLLLTNINPPSEYHRDYEPFQPSEAGIPGTYEQAQAQMRDTLASHFSALIWKEASLRKDFESSVGKSISSENELSQLLRDKFLPDTTPPLLIKNTGLAKELFVFYKLIKMKLGYVIPTLLYQRIFRELGAFLSGTASRLVLVRVPDFLIVRGGRTIGVELGRERAFFGTQKGVLVTTFAAACGVPTTQVNVQIGNPVIGKWQDLGFKCNRCYRSFVLCPKFIAGEIGDGAPFEEVGEDQMTCEKLCEELCEEAAVLANIFNFRTSRTNQKIVHYKCLRSEEMDENLRPVPLVPRVEGAEALLEWAL